jgi:peptidoglycan/xylan/chitin deacetylase (PgdA/CDA1 family)
MLNQLEKKTVPILMYHSIAHTDNSRFQQFAVSPVLFAEQMAYLQAHAYTTLTVTQFVSLLAQKESVLPERPVVLTFDDGFADFYTAALPILKSHGFVATLFVTTAYVNATSRWLQKEGETARPMLTWEQLSELPAHGIECGAHGHSHAQLDILPGTSARAEIEQSKKCLEDCLGRTITSFAYPFGYQTARIRKLVQAAGYTAACAVKHGMSTARDDPFALRRLMVRRDMNNNAFATLLSGAYLSPLEGLATMYMRARTPLWQLIRRCSAFMKLYG